jgi:hypothetical protein
MECPEVSRPSRDLEGAPLEEHDAARVYGRDETRAGCSKHLLGQAIPELSFLGKIVHAVLVS